MTFTRTRTITVVTLVLWGLAVPAAAQLSSGDIAALRAQGEEEGWTFTVGENEAAGRPLEELCGLVEPPDWRRDGRFDPGTPSRDLPFAFDWRELGACPPVRNQGGCGSCWAFATVGPLESNILIVDGAAVNLSEQWLVSCNQSGWGCDGGWWAHGYHESSTDACGGTGAVLESDFPYVAYDALCDCPYSHEYVIDDWAYIGSSSGVPTRDSIKNAILDYGPVSVAVYANSAMQGYTGGVFNGCANGTVNHGVVLVGWDDNQGPEGVWIMRNSWGSGWGENGYMRMRYGCSRIGYAASYVVYGVRDCNDNGIPDADDVAAGTSEDCNDNRIPDECESQDDCQPNGTLDICEVYAGFSEDCNNNRIPDECESQDDCQSNGLKDICEVYAGSSEDCQPNGVPDECETAGNDCNENDVPDECDPQNDCQPNGVQDICEVYAGSSEDCQPNGVPDECETEGNDCNANNIPDECDIAGSTSRDCQWNRTPDECELLGNDCNDNGTPDECETDCNDNGHPDDCDTAAGTSLDCNNNTTPDECEPDCNGNGVADECDIGQGTSDDCNGNAWPDECDVLRCADLWDGFGADPPFVPYGGVHGIDFVAGDGSTWDNPSGSAIVRSPGCETGEFTDSMIRVTAPLSSPEAAYVASEYFQTDGGELPPEMHTYSLSFRVRIDASVSSAYDWEFFIYDAISGEPAAHLVFASDQSLAAAHPGHILVAANGLTYPQQFADTGVPIDLATCYDVKVVLDNLRDDDETLEVYVDGELKVTTARLRPDARRMDYLHVQPVDNWAEASTMTRFVMDSFDLCINGILVPPSVYDCNSNGWLDECDIAAGTSTDVDGNGTPDDCEGCPYLYDLDGSCLVDSVDLGLFAVCWLLSEGQAGWDENACPDKDFDCSGTVDSVDLGLLAGAWLKSHDQMDASDYPQCRACSGPVMCSSPGALRGEGGGTAGYHDNADRHERMDSSSER